LNLSVTVFFPPQRPFVIEPSQGRWSTVQNFW